MKVDTLVPKKILFIVLNLFLILPAVAGESCANFSNSKANCRGGYCDSPQTTDVAGCYALCDANCGED